MQPLQIDNLFSPQVDLSEDPPEALPWDTYLAQWRGGSADQSSPITDLVIFDINADELFPGDEPSLFPIVDIEDVQRGNLSFTPRHELRGNRSSLDAHILAFEFVPEPTALTLLGLALAAVLAARSVRARAGP